MHDLYKCFENAFPEKVQSRNLRRGEKLLRFGQREKYTYFVVSGALRAYCLTDGAEQNIRFGYQGSILTSLPSFFTGAPSILEIEALRKTSLKCYDRAHLRLFMSSASEHTTRYISILENLVSQTLDREMDLLLSDPLDRNQRVLKRSPALFQEIPLRHIANYLRMTPEHLSRLRKS